VYRGARPSYLLIMRLRLLLCVAGGKCGEDGGGAILLKATTAGEYFIASTKSSGK